jgi:hypothetical protein
MSEPRASDEPLNMPFRFAQPSDRVLIPENGIAPADRAG